LSLEQPGLPGPCSSFCVMLDSLSPHSRPLLHDQRPLRLCCAGSDHHSATVALTDHDSALLISSLARPGTGVALRTKPLHSPDAHPRNGAPAALHPAFGQLSCVRSAVQACGNCDQAGLEPQWSAAAARTQGLCGLCLWSWLAVHA
jgi:hypothetical protein